MKKILLGCTRKYLTLQTFNYKHLFKKILLYTFKAVFILNRNYNYEQYLFKESNLYFPYRVTKVYKVFPEHLDCRFVQISILLNVLPLSFNFCIRGALEFLIFLVRHYTNSASKFSYNSFEKFYFNVLIVANNALLIKN